MNRRCFLKTFSLTLVGSQLIDSTRLLSAAVQGPTHGSTVTEATHGTLLSIVKGSDPAAATAKAVEGLGGLSRFVARGDVVLIKPNMSWERTPAQAANTSPVVVATLVRLAYDQGAKQVKVFDNTCGDSRRCYMQSGIAEAARSAGAEVSFVEDGHFTRTELGGENLTEWSVHREALDVDKIINVPVAKHHSLTRLTLSMKNLMGLIGGGRNQLHERIDTNIVDLAAYFRPQLTVLDATRVLTRNGPQGGSLAHVRKMDTVVASADPVAVDAYGATLFGMKGDDLRYVREACERGLGEKDLSRVSTIEEVLR